MIDLKPALAATFLFLMITGCSTNPTEPASNTTDSNPVLSVENAAENMLNIDMTIDALDDSCLTDSSYTRIRRRVNQALYHLDVMLDRARVIVMYQPDDSAKALYHEAVIAMQNAREAVRADSFQTALDHIHQSRLLAMEAVSLVRENRQELREDIIAGLTGQIDDVRALLEEAAAQWHNNPDERAGKLLARGNHHMHLGVSEFRDGHYRAARYHLLRAQKYALAVLRILNPGQDPHTGPVSNP